MSSTTTPANTPIPTGVVALLFFLSGAACLGFEVVWAKQLGFILGGTMTAVAYVVALFMGGMAGGYAVGGRLSKRFERPVAVYGVVECALALLALVAVWTIPALQVVSGEVWAWLGAAALILPCTFLAGATLPLLVEATPGTLGGALGRLYGLNTTGAVVGVMVVGLVLIGAVGLKTSALALAVLGCAVGATAIAVGRRPHRIAPTPQPTPTSSDASHEGLAEGASKGVIWVFLASICGFASLAEEVLWTRALLPHLNSSTYALTIILAVFLGGLALGAAIASRQIERRPEGSALLLMATQLVAAIFVAFSPELLDLADTFVEGYVGVRRATGLAVWLETIFVALGRATFALVPPTLMLGFALPLLAQLYAGKGGLARGVAAGRLAGWNTLGCVAGALVARFVFLPWLGVVGSLQATAALHLVVAGAVILAVTRGSDEPLARRLGYAAPVLLLLIIVFGRPPAEPFLGRLVAQHEVLMVDEGIQDTTAVVERSDPNSKGARHIFSNGIAYAGDTPSGKRYMRLLGHLPALHAREQRRAMVICIGTGMTASAVARHPAFERLDFVDISPVVHRTLPYFDRSNDRVYTDPRAQFHIQDGRIFLAHAEHGSYDVVTLEPPPPRAVGVAALYSREFYEDVRLALTPGGAVAQWLPIHGLTTEELAMLARTFVEVFPNAVLYKLLPYEAALVATNGPGASPEEVARRLKVPGVAEHLAGIKAPSPLSLPHIRGAKLKAALGEGPVVTDDHPRIEHFGAGLTWQESDDTASGQHFMKKMSLKE